MKKSEATAMVYRCRYNPEPQHLKTSLHSVGCREKWFMKYRNSVHSKYSVPSGDTPESLQGNERDVHVHTNLPAIHAVEAHTDKLWLCNFMLICSCIFSLF